MSEAQHCFPITGPDGAFEVKGVDGIMQVRTASTQ